MNPVDPAFELFLATTCRKRMSPDEKKIFDWHVRVEKEIRAYARKKRERQAGDIGR